MKKKVVLWYIKEGNEAAGLEHIILRHLADFHSAFGITRDELPAFLKEVVSKGRVVSNIKSKISNGYDRVYDYEGNYFTVAGIGSNGFIVTAFPQTKEA